ncbi:MAG: hypothetical protein ACI841_003843 [Planctomycetota bacterium]|jgi:hypothetical protein
MPADSSEQHDAPADSYESVQEPARIGPIALLLPILTLATLYWWFDWGRSKGLEQLANPPAPISTRTIPGWAALQDFPGGLQLDVSFTKLHADSSQQEFDGTALGKRFGKSGGEPYRLTLRLSAGEGHSQLAYSEAWLDQAGLRTLAIDSSDGTSLDVLVSHKGAATAGIYDPLQVLMAPPVEGLSINEQISLILWGIPPLGELSLRGVVGGAIALSPVDMNRAEVVRALARLDPEWNDEDK